MNFSNPRIAVVGAGAVGAYYGGRLAQHGRDVHFLLRSDYAAVKEQGWNVRSHEGDFVLPPQDLNVYRSPADMPKADLVIVTLKATANDQYEPLIRPLLHDGSAILTLQNGLGNEDRLASLFGARRILGGLAFVCINRVSPTEVHHIDHGLIRLGEFVEGTSPRARAVVDLFNACRIRTELLPSLRYGRWEKLIWNIPFNGLGAALDLTTDRLIDTPDGREMVSRIMAEVIAAAKSQGVSFPADIIQQKFTHTETMGSYQSSMQIDRRMRRPMEVEAILGEPVRVARSAGVSVPTLEMLYNLVKLVDLGNTSGPAAA